MAPTGLHTSQKYLVLGADTVVALDGTILGKPANESEAFAFLSALAGKTHKVITGCALVPVVTTTPSAHPDTSISDSCNEDSTFTFSVCTHVKFWQCPPPLLAHYSRSQEVKDKAGAYAIQGEGAFLASSITGSWTNVVGLPVAELITTLMEKKILTLAT